jgi:hypothetical protein
MGNIPPKTSEPLHSFIFIYFLREITSQELNQIFEMFLRTNFSSIFLGSTLVTSQIVTPFSTHDCSQQVFYSGDHACNNDLATCCVSTGICCAGGCCPYDAYCVFVGIANEACCSLSDKTQCGEAPPVRTPSPLVQFSEREYANLCASAIHTNLPHRLPSRHPLLRRFRELVLWCTLLIQRCYLQGLQLPDELFTRLERCGCELDSYTITSLFSLFASCKCKDAEFCCKK